MANNISDPNSDPVVKPSLLAIPWALCGIVTLLGLYVCGQSFDWSFGHLSTYQIFPVLGLLAFSIMWTHYMVGLMHRTFLKGADLRSFFSWTGYAVLVLLVFHPGLLIFQRFVDGFGLPPGSYKSYVAPGVAWLTMLGSVCLLIFLAFEFKRWFDNKKWWPYVLILNDIAMVAIFYHGLRLGSQIQIDWFKYIWWFYGITLILALAHKYTMRIQQHSLRES